MTLATERSEGHDEAEGPGRAATTAPAPDERLHCDITTDRLDPRLLPGRARFVVLSFEGPDRYSSAGGLGVRVHGLTRALADAGYDVDLLFVGDPDLPGIEVVDGVRLRRWCQAISAHARSGVYAEQEAKIEDLCVWLPDNLANEIADGADAGQTTIVLAEDWQMAWPLIATHDLLVERGLRRHAILAWNANNRFGFERIDFGRLARAAMPMTVSRAMKHVMWQWGVNPHVLPNGLPEEWSDPPPADAHVFRSAFDCDLLFTKVGRWDPDKRWRMTIESLDAFRSRRSSALLLARGWAGNAEASGHYRELRELAEGLELPWLVCESAGEELDEVVDAFASSGTRGPAVMELAFPMDDRQLRRAYSASDAVLANSGFEPFGLVGLEVMASGGIVITGSSGEDYVDHLQNGFALDTDDPREIVDCLERVQRDPAIGQLIRAEGVRTSQRYCWEAIVERFLDLLDRTMPPGLA